MKDSVRMCAAVPRMSWPSSGRLTRRLWRESRSLRWPRSLGVSAMTLHRWRAEYGAVDREAVRRTNDLEWENARLKRLVAARASDIQIL